MAPKLNTSEQQQPQQSIATELFQIIDDAVKHVKQRPEGLRGPFLYQEEVKALSSRAA